MLACACPRVRVCAFSRAHASARARQKSDINLRLIILDTCLIMDSFVFSPCMYIIYIIHFKRIKNIHMGHPSCLVAAKTSLKTRRRTPAAGAPPPPRYRRCSSAETVACVETPLGATASRHEYLSFPGRAGFRHGALCSSRENDFVCTFIHT